MLLHTVDWVIIITFFVISFLIGVYYSKRAGKSSTEFFLSGKTMPWWLLGFSMVATTFSCDTPNLVTDIVRKNGVSGNWVWWAFLLTGMTTVFIYSKLWRRSQVFTDIEFYELRYGGPKAAFLRGFRAVYLGLFFNIMIMATVCLAAIKIGHVMLGFTPYQTLIICCIVVSIYSALGGYMGVLVTDFFQFIVAMIGSVMAAWYALSHPKVDGLSNLLSNPAVQGKLDLLPDFNDPAIFIPVLLIPLTLQWWSAWYPGAEPGGGGYIAQRMLSAKNEKHAVGATLFFNITHYALRPWPWIIVGLCSLVVFPDLASMRTAYPNIDEQFLKDDLGYSAMLTFLPPAVLGLVVASLIAAFISTIATHLNWGSSYLVNDVYKRFVKPEASEKELVGMGRLSTVTLMVISCVLALFLSSATEGFAILLQIGAGTGIIFLLRWFWWRINANTEIVGMVASLTFAILFKINASQGWFPLADHWQFAIGALGTTLVCILTALFTQPEDDETLRKFYENARPAAMGWQGFLSRNPAVRPEQGQLSLEILCAMSGCFTVYGFLFASGYWLYGNTVPALICSAVAVAGGAALIKLWPRLKMDRS